MSIKSINATVTGLVQVLPRIVYIQCDDSLSTITTANYLKTAVDSGLASFYPTDLVAVTYANNVSQLFTLTITTSAITLVPAYITPSNSAGQTIQSSETSATPGTVRALTGKITNTATTMTSGNIVGIRGEVDCVGASGGFIYGAQGKVIATGTFSGSSWTAGLFGQFDISAATVNAGQLAAIWGDWGTTGATATDLTGCRGIAFTNTTSNVLNAQDYRYGNATYLLELAGAGGTLNYYAAAGTSSGSAGNSTHCAAQQVIKIEINGAAAYIPVFTQNT